MVRHLCQFFLRGTGYTNIQFPEALAAIGRYDLGVKMFGDFYPYGSLANGCGPCYNNNGFLF